MKYLYILLSLLLTACASTPTDEKRSDSQTEVDSEIASLKNEDFKPVGQIRYNEAVDYHVIGDVVDDALKDETLAKVEPDTIKKTSEQMSGIASLCHLGKTKDGLKILDDLFPKYKSNPTYWNQIGSCYYKSGDMRKAQVFYNKAISLEANYLPAINNIGVIYLHEGKVEKAVAAFKRVLEINNSSKTAKYNLGNVYIKYGLFDLAKKYMEEILRYDNKDKDVLLALTYVELYKNNANGALSYLSRVPTQFLTRTDFSLALLFSYKISKNDKFDIVAKALLQQNLNSYERKAYDSIMGLKI